MLSYLAAHWYLLMLRGLAAVLFGVAVLAWPMATIAVLVMLFGAFAIVDGVFAIIAAIAGSGMNAPWWALLLEGLLGIGAGIATFTWPALTAMILLYLIASWAVVTGVFEIIAAIQLRKEIRGEFFLGLAGLISIAFGLFLFARPGEGALAVVTVIGIYQIVFGVALMALALQFRSWGKKLPAAKPGRAVSG